jgi:hypothetical protein
MSLGLVKGLPLLMSGFAPAIRFAPEGAQPRLAPGGILSKEGLGPTRPAIGGAPDGRIPCGAGMRVA